MTISAISLFAAPTWRPQASGAGQTARLLDALGAGRNTLDPRQNAIEQVATQLTALRDALQTWHNRGASTSSDPDLRALLFQIDQTTQATTYSTENVYQTQPVYEDQDIMGTVVTGTQSLSGFSSTAAAGIVNGNDFSVQVGSDAAATIEFRSSTRIRVTIGASHTDFNFSSTGGDWLTGLTDALNSIANLTASITADGNLELQTADAQSLTIADVAGGGSPLAELGLSAGTTDASVIGTQQVQVGTEQVLVGTEQVEGGTIQLPQGSQSIVVGYDRIQNSIPNPTNTAEVRDAVHNLVSAVGALTDAAGGAAGPANEPGISGQARAFAASLSDLLSGPDFDALGDPSDAGAFDRVMAQLDDALSQAKAIGAETVASPSTVNAATQLQASLITSLLEGAGAGSFALARQTSDAFGTSNSGFAESHRLSIWS